MPLPDWCAYIESLRSGDEKSVARYLKEDIDPRITLDGTNNALDIASGYGHLSIVTTFLNLPVFISMHSKDLENMLRSALEQAFASTQFDVVEVLLKIAEKYITRELTITYGFFNVEAVKKLRESAIIGDIEFAKIDGQTTHVTYDFLVETGKRDVLTLLISEGEVSEELLVMEPGVDPLQLACVLGHRDTVCDLLTKIPSYDTHSFRKTLFSAALTGDFELLDYILEKVKAKESVPVVWKIMQCLMSAAIGYNRMDIVTWGLEHEQNDRASYVKWCEISDIIQDEQQGSVCEMLKLVFQYKYDNQYNPAVKKPDLWTLFNRACLQNDSKTAKFILENYRQHMNWRYGDHDLFGHNFYDIVKLLCDFDLLDFNKEFTKRFVREIFLGIVDSMEEIYTRHNYRFSALPCFELILKQMKKMNYYKLNPYEVYLSRRAYHRGQRMLPLSWCLVYAHTQATMCLIGQYFPFPEKLPFRISRKEQLHNLKLARILSCTLCVGFRETMSERGKKQIVKWLCSRNFLNSCLCIGWWDFEFFIHDFVMAVAGTDDARLVELDSPRLAVKLYRKFLVYKMCEDDYKIELLILLCRLCGVSVDIRPLIVVLSNFALDWKNLIDRHRASNPLTLAEACRLVVLRRLRQRRAHIINSVRALEGTIPPAVVKYLLFNDFYSQIWSSEFEFDSA